MMSSSTRLGLPLLLLTFAACGSFLPPRSTAPPPAPSERSAWVVFLLDDPRATTFHTVRDERGEILGRLAGQSWFAVERGPGTQWFFTGDHWTLQTARSREGRGISTVGVLSANLEVGRVYLVRVATTEGDRRSLADTLGEWRSEDGCVMVDDDEDRRPDFVDLIGIRPGGAEWNRALGVLREGVRYRAAPRGLSEEDVSQLPTHGRARVGHCVDAARSRLMPDDGSPFWPLTPIDPSDALIF